MDLILVRVYIKCNFYWDWLIKDREFIKLLLLNILLKCLE